MARYRDEVRDGDHGHNAAAKRKLDDRELRPDELERRDVRPPPFDNRTRPSHTPNKSVKRRAYDSPPPWAQQATRGTTLKEPNFVLYKPVHAPGHGPAQINGHSRHPSPEEKRPVPRAQEPVPRAHEIRPNERSATPSAQGPPPEAQAKWGPLGPWEPTLTGDVPQDTMAKVMADFFFHYIVLNENMGEIQSRGIQFEIEAKFGELIDRNTNQRIELGVLSPTILKEDDYVYPFRSIMTEAQHRSYNEYLNHQVVVSKNPKSNIGRERPRIPISYEHKHEIDRFYAIPPQIRDRHLPVTVANLLASKGRDAKVRVSFKENKDGSREQIAKIVKARLKDLSIHFPEHRLDCRISINLEMPWEGPIEELEAYATGANKGQSPDRRKNRLSYGHCSYQFDLTQVVENVNGRDEKKHELEIELDPKAVLDQGRRAREGQPNQYFDLVEGFLNNIRIMAKMCA
ncbi:mRNA-capping enzyme subunit beta [Neurospora sp. IMI 360204]|nr:mRNA-capping enzyme subunit beta [Neurospora sp. IMI 360204]